MDYTLKILPFFIVQKDEICLYKILSISQCKEYPSFRFEDDDFINLLLILYIIVTISPSYHLIFLVFVLVFDSGFNHNHTICWSSIIIIMKWVSKMLWGYSNESLCLSLFCLLYIPAPFLTTFLIFVIYVLNEPR